VAPFDGSFVSALTYEIKGDVADRGHVLGPVSATRAALILIESYVKARCGLFSMANGLVQPPRSLQPTAPGDVGTPLGLDLVATLDAALLIVGNRRVR
jgi:hypothetical protein